MLNFLTYMVGVSDLFFLLYMAVDLQGFLSNAQDIQELLKKAKGNIEEMVATGRGKFGVTVKMNGKYHILSVTIPKEARNEPLEVLAEAFREAGNDAVSQINEKAKKALSVLTNDLGLPAGDSDSDSGSDD
jgi:DNA-binding protein YbaB